jgi:hypothetical protein
MPFAAYILYSPSLDRYPSRRKCRVGCLPSACPLAASGLYNPHHRTYKAHFPDVLWNVAGARLRRIKGRALGRLLELPVKPSAGILL